MNSFWQDLRYGARMLMKKPSFTLIAVITLALGIGANTTIFSAAESLILHPFSFANQDRLVMVYQRKPELNVQRLLGRVFQSGEDTAGREQVAILKHSLWQRRFGGNPNIVEQTMKTSRAIHECA